MLSGKRDSNSRPQPWQGCALPTELFPQIFSAHDKNRTCTSLNTRTWNERVYHSATWALSSVLKERLVCCRRAENETRTRDPNLGKVVLYQLSYFRIFSDCECKGTTFSWTDKTFQEKNALKLLFLFAASPYTLFIYRESGVRVPF